MKIINENDLHDGEIMCIKIDNSKSLLEIYIQPESGSLLSIVFDGVVSFRCEDLTMQNIINNFWVYSRICSSDNDLDKWLSWTTSLSDAPSWLRAENRKRIFDECRQGKLLVSVLIPSAGAQIGVIYQHHTLQCREENSTTCRQLITDPGS